nr:putative ribonuclease H-like domain-containing protein [Tanacetum cinerariifolium]
MITGIKIESDADSEGEEVFAADDIPAGVSVPVGTIVAAVVSAQSETEFALMGLSTELAYEEKIRVLSYELEEKSSILEYRQKLIDQAEQEKQKLMTKLDNEIANQAKWNNSGKNLYKLIYSSMSSRTKRGLGLDKYIGEGELGIDDSKFSIFHTNSNELEGQSIYNRFALVDHMKAVPPPLTGNYMPPSNIPDIDESQVMYGKKATNSSEIKSNDDSISHSNDSVHFDFNDRSSKPSTHDLQTCDSNVECSRPNHNDRDSTDYISSVSAPAKSHFRKDKSVASKSGYVCGSYLHLIKDYDFHEQTFAKRNAEGNGILGRRPTGKPVNPNRQNLVSAGQPNPVSAGQQNAVSAGQPNPVSVGQQNTVSAGLPNLVSAGQPNPVYTGDGILSPQPLNIQPKSTYFHSFTHKNQQILFRITHNLLYLLYMTGGLNGKTAVNPFVGNKDKLEDFEDFDGGQVTFGGSIGKISRKGTIKTKNLNFENVLYVEELQHFNLIAYSHICDQAHRVLFTENECLVLFKDFPLLDPSMVILSILRKHNLYTFSLNELAPKGPLTCLIAKALQDESTLWHMRLGHVNFRNLNKLVKGNLVRGLPSKVFQNNHTCIACNKGKQHKASYKAIPSISLINEPLHLLHMDLFVPTSVRSINNKYYYLVIAYEYTRFSWVYFLEHKSDTFLILKIFITLVENQFNHKVKAIRCDNGTEFKNANLIEFCGFKGIRRDYSNARTPQQNGVAKRKNQTLIEATRTMVADSLFPTIFWSEVVATGCYVLYRVLVTKPYHKTHYELLTGDKPSISYLKPFGCHVTILNTSDPLGKFDKKSDEGYIVGYFISSKTYRVYNLVSRRIDETMNLNFLENKPFVAGTGQAWMFDINYLTDSLNYSRVSITNLTTGSQGATPSNAVVPIVDEATTQNDGTKSDLTQINADNLDELAKLQALQRQEQAGKEEADLLGLAFLSLNPILGVGTASIGSFVSVGGTPPVFAGSTPQMSPPTGSAVRPVSAGKPTGSVGRPVSAGRPTSSAGRLVSAGRLSIPTDRSSVPAGRILGKCKKQTIVATSFCEAEYVAAASCCGQWFLFTSAGRVTFCWLFAIPAGDLVSAGHILFLLGSASEVSLLDGVKGLVATIDGTAYTVTEASIRSALQLDDLNAINTMTNEEFFAGLWDIEYTTKGKFIFFKNKFSPQWKFLIHTLIHCLSPKSGSWNQFSSNIAIALIFLSTGRKYNFSNMIFNGMCHNGPDMPLLAHMLNQGEPAFVQAQQQEVSPPPPSPVVTSCPSLDPIPSPPRQSSPPPIPYGPAPSFGVVSTKPIPDIPSLSEPSEPVPTEGVADEPLTLTSLPAQDTVVLFAKRNKKLESKLKTKKRKLVLSDSENEEEARQSQELDALLHLANAALHDPTRARASKIIYKRIKKQQSSSGLDFTDATIPAAGLDSASGLDLLVVLFLLVVDPAKGKAVATPSSPVTALTDKELADQQAAIHEAKRQELLEQELKQNLDAKQLYLNSLLAQRVAEEQERESRATAAQLTQRQAELDRVALNLTNEEWIGLVDHVQANPTLFAELLGADVSEDTFSIKMVELINQRRKAIAEMKAKAKTYKPITLAQQKEFMPTFIHRAVDLATAKDHHQHLKRSGETLESSASKKLKSSHSTEQPAELYETTSVSAGATIAAGDPIPAVTSVSAASSVPAGTPSIAGVSTTAGASRFASEASVPIIELLDSPPKDTSLPLDLETEDQDVPLRKSSRKKSIARRRTLPSPSKSKFDALPFDGDDPEAEFKKYLRQVSDDDEPAEPVSLALVSNIRRADLMVLYGMVLDKYKIERATGIGLGLWSNLRTLITAREYRDASIIWDDQDQDIIYMFVDKKYPLTRETIQRMLNHGLEIDRDLTGNDLTAAIQLIQSLVNQLNPAA